MSPRADSGTQHAEEFLSNGTSISGDCNVVVVFNVNGTNRPNKDGLQLQQELKVRRRRGA